MKRACVFAHFDLEGKVDQHVIFYLQKLCKIASPVIFVTVSILDQKSRDELFATGVVIVQRDNVGYDFYSYKTGLEQLNLKDFDDVILCNDSVYGPLFSLEEVFKKMEGRPCDFWGLTESYEIARHVQSYFLVFRRVLLDAEVFHRFWETMVVLEHKREIVERYEVGLSQQLLAAGFSLDSFVATENSGIVKRFRQSWRQYLRTIGRRWNEKEFWLDVVQIVFMGRSIAVNPTHMEWRALLSNSDLPFIKVELLRDNPKGISDLSDVFNVIESRSDYPVELISNHLSRVKRS
jgi:lipopolysaccharide biosynthesis protein